MVSAPSTPTGGSLNSSFDESFTEEFENASTLPKTLAAAAKHKKHKRFPWLSTRSSSKVNVDQCDDVRNRKCSSAAGSTESIQTKIVSINPNGNASKLKSSSKHHSSTQSLPATRSDDGITCNRKLDFDRSVSAPAPDVDLTRNPSNTRRSRISSVFQIFEHEVQAIEVYPGGHGDLLNSKRR